MKAIRASEKTSFSLSTRNSTTLKILAGALCAAYFSVAAGDLQARLSHDTFGCLSKELSSRLIEIAQSGDNEAFARGYASGVLSGQCRKFTAGAPVYITAASLLSGLTSIRAQGDLGAYWVPTSHVDTSGTAAAAPSPKPKTPPSDSDLYGSGKAGFENWARQEYSAEKFRYIGGNEVWIVTSAHAPDGWYVAAAESIAEHYRSFMSLTRPVTAKVFADNHEVGSANTN
jgi:hypothetical protein